MLKRFEITRYLCSLVATISFVTLGCEATSLESSSLELASLEQEIDDELTPAEEIAEFLKDTVAEMTAEEMDAKMLEHYQRLRLIDESGNWSLPRLSDISDFLLPGNLGEAASFDLIDHMARAAEDNEYLADFLARAQDENFADYMGKVDAEGDVVFPDVIAYAHVLDRLTIAMREDWHILEDCMNFWKEVRKVIGVSDHMDLFEHAKLFSVELPMNKFVESHRDEYVPDNYMKAILPVNIMEAVAVDWADKMFDNGYAGTVLAKYKPGSRRYNDKTGEGPSCFSDDGNAIWLKMALPRKWADLYAVWNLAFVTSYSHPYIMVKLLIPSVNDYKEEPAEYIYNRGMALYTHIHFELFRRVDFANAGTSEVSWPDEHLRKFFGAANKDYARQYDNAVKVIKYPWMFWLR